MIHRLTPPAERDRESGPVSRPDVAASDGPPVARIGAGEAGAFEELFRTHYGKLCGTVYRLLGSREDAEEVVQEVLRRVWEARGRWPAGALDDSLERYCYRAVRNEAINRLRRHRREATWYRRTTVTPDHDTAFTGGSHDRPADQQVEHEEILTAVARAVEALPERCRLVFELKWEHGLRYAEIAEALGITEKTVENQLLKAVKAIRLAVGER